MTFSEFMIEARYRLGDVRTPSGTIINDATVDGIRWSSQRLAILCKGAMHEMLRTFRGWVAKDKKVKTPLNNFINNAIQTRILSGLTIENGRLNGIGEKYYKLHRLQAGDYGLMYDEVDAETYFSKRWRTLPMNELSQCPIDERWFTPISDENGGIEIRTVPISADPINNVEAIITIPLDTILTITSTIDLPFVDINDILLDFVDKEASLIEHNPEQVKYLFSVINQKIGLIQNELQESTR